MMAIRERYLADIGDRMAGQRELLRAVLSHAKDSALYRGRIDSNATLEELDSLPITQHSGIVGAIGQYGAANVLLMPPDYEFHTSGSTGDVKKVFFSHKDLERIADDYVQMTQMVGICQADTGWNFGGAPPLVSGTVMDTVIQKIGLRGCISTLLRSDTDLVRSLKKASHADRVDVTAGAALLYFLIARTCNQPSFLHDLVRGKLVRDYYLPGPLATIIARLYLVGLDRKNLIRIAQEVRLGISYAEPLTAYMKEIAKAFPNIRMVDVFGSTENPLMAAQLDAGSDGLSMFVDSLIAEIVEPIDIAGITGTDAVRVKGTPWWRWTKGMRGELVLTRDGECLPLVRYATGDVIEVLDPDYPASVMTGHDQVTVRMPLIKVLGRSSDTLDFEVQDDSGNFLGNKVYTRQINDALQGADNVRWWELFVVGGDPGRMVFVVIPSNVPDDPKGFHRGLVHRLLNECDDPLHTFKIGADLGRFEVLVTPPDAFLVIQSEIDRRVREGRSIGQMKPKRICIVGREDLEGHLRIRGLA